MGLFSARNIQRILSFGAALVLGTALVFGDMYQEQDNEGLTVFRSLLIPSGGRSESLGTAFTGLSDDISFFEYNPAASSLLKETEAAAFHNRWIADSAVETLAFTQRNNDFGYGVMAKCFYVPFTEYDYFGQELNTSYYTESVAILNLSYNFLHGYSFKGIALGTNLKAALRTVPDYADDTTGIITEGSGRSQSAVALLADAGMLLRFNFLKFYNSREPNFSMGIAAVNFGTDTINDEPLPSRIAVGASYRVVQPAVLTFEFQQPVNLKNMAESEHWVAGTGIEVQVTDFFSVQGGFLLKGANPRFSLGAQYDITSRVTMNVNYTYDITSSLNPLNRVSLALKTHLGDRGRAKVQEEVDTYYLLGIDYYTRGDLNMAIELWQKALMLNKRYDPVKIALQAAEDTMRVEQMMLDLQRID